jgi:hypothetical protein
MSKLLIIAGIDTRDSVASGEHNGVLLSCSSDAENWCNFRIPQGSIAAPSFAVWNTKLWAAFRGRGDTKLYVIGPRIDGF